MPLEADGGPGPTRLCSTRPGPGPWRTGPPTGRPLSRATSPGVRKPRPRADTHHALGRRHEGPETLDDYRNAAAFSSSTVNPGTEAAARTANNSTDSQAATTAADRADPGCGTCSGGTGNSCSDDK